MKKDKRINNDLQIITQKTKYRSIRTPGEHRFQNKIQAIADYGSLTSLVLLK
jgi:hypothetical protein